MYTVMTRNNDATWSLVSRHRLFARAQASARRRTSAKIARERVYHRADVCIMVEGKRGGVLGYLGPQSHDF